MTDQKLLQVIALYDDEIRARLDGAPPRPPARWYLYGDELRHVLEMLPQMRTFIEEGRREKVMRWLGFVQGTLYVARVYSIEAMKNHNRPDEPVTDECMCEMKEGWRPCPKDLCERPDHMHKQAAALGKVIDSFRT